MKPDKDASGEAGGSAEGEGRIWAASKAAGAAGVLAGSEAISQGRAIRCSTASARETQAVAASIAPHLKPGDLVLLSGDLGAGKTTFVQAVATALGVTEPVTSPTFALAHHYSGQCDLGKCELRHIDLYRLADPAEMLDYILDELDSAIVLVEWGDPLAAEFPEARLDVKLSFDATRQETVESQQETANRRNIELVGIGDRWGSVLAEVGSALEAMETLTAAETKK